MGASRSSCTIYDPNNNGYDLQPLAKKYYVSVSDWKLDDEKRMICEENPGDLLFEFMEYDRQKFYRKLQELGLKIIEYEHDYIVGTKKISKIRNIEVPK